MQKIMVVGDTHAQWGELNQLISRHTPDIVLQCGDFGYWPKMETKRKVSMGMVTPAWVLEGVKPNNTKVYWCDGNHEDHEALRPMVDLMERNPIEIYKNVFFCPRGSVLELSDGRNVMFIGGAYSIDKEWRTPGVSWFEEELITYKQQEFILDYSGKVDIVISHTCPTEWQPEFYFPGKQEDPTRKVLSAVLEKFKPSLWYHGHWHSYKKGFRKDTFWTSLSCFGHPGKHKEFINAA